MRTLIYAVVLLTLWSGSAAADTHYHLGVDGIPCPFCLYGIEKNLKKLDGVTEVGSDIEGGWFFVKVADGAELSEEVATDLVTKAGFTLRSFEVHLQDDQ